jgi:hypothetical protein
MAYVQVPKDLTRVKTKFLLNLTKRQCICFALAALVGIPFYLLTRGALGQTISAVCMVVLMLPFFFFAMYEKDGRPLEVLLKNVIVAKILRPGIRPYKTENMYAALQRQVYEKEVLRLGEEDYRRAGIKGGGKKEGSCKKARKLRKE